MRRDLVYGNASDLNQYTDFKKLKTNVLAHTKEDMKKMVNNKLKDNPYASFGMIFATGMIEKAVDSMISPSGLKSMFKSGQKEPKNYEDIGYDFTYKNFNLVEVQGDKSILILERNGIFSWKLIDFVKPGNN
jgi:hypothetical protein